MVHRALELKGAFTGLLVPLPSDNISWDGKLPLFTNMMQLATFQQEEMERGQEVREQSS